MPKKKQKMLVLDYDSDTTAAIRDTLSQHCDVSFVDSLKKAAAKAMAGKFDVIITGYLVPAVSGKKTVSCLNNIKKAISQAETSVKQKRAAGKKALRESQKNQARIIELLTGHIRQFEVERLELKQQVQSLEKKASIAKKKKTEAEKKAKNAQKEKIGAERKAEEADKKRGETEKIIDAEKKVIADAEKKAIADAKEKGKAALMEKAEDKEKLNEAIKTTEALNVEVASLREELKSAVSIAETAVEERNQLEEKLARFQENWEKYMGRQGA